MAKRKNNPNLLFRFLHSQKKQFSPRQFVFGIGLGLVMISLALYLNLYQRPTFAKVPDLKQDVKIPKKTFPPTVLEIPSLHLSLPIVQTYIDNNTWEISEEGISHLNTSKNPGSVGAIILYGHNTHNRLGGLPAIKLGDKIILSDSRNETFTYQVYETAIVWPYEVQILEPKNFEEVIIYTCTGIGDLQRFVAKAKRV